MPPKTTSELKTVIKETIKEVFSDEDFLKTFFKTIYDKIAVLEKTINTQEEKIKLLENKLDNVQQTTKSNNICIYGIQEQEKEDLQGKVLQIINEKMRIEVQKNDIVKCYRIGINKNKLRPIIVTFENQNKRNLVLRNSKTLKGTKIGISEDLIKNRWYLRKIAQERLDRKNVFTHDGNIYVTIGNKKHRINSEDELQEILNN